jgi:hypothetical protein
VPVSTVVFIFSAIVMVTVMVMGHIWIVVSRIPMSKELPLLTARAVWARLQGVIVRLKRFFRIVGKMVVPLFAFNPDPQWLPDVLPQFHFSLIHK